MQHQIREMRLSSRCVAGEFQSFRLWEVEARNESNWTRVGSPLFNLLSPEFPAQTAYHLHNSPTQLWLNALDNATPWQGYRSAGPVAFVQHLYSISSLLLTGIPRRSTLCLETIRTTVDIEWCLRLIRLIPVFDTLGTYQAQAKGKSGSWIYRVGGLLRLHVMSPWKPNPCHSSFKHVVLHQSRSWKVNYVLLCFLQVPLPTLLRRWPPTIRPLGL